MNTITPHASVDITMVGGTMPGLMFYAGFMEELSKYQHFVQLNSVSGTSAGAAVGAMVSMGKAQEAPEIFLKKFQNTGVSLPLQWLKPVYEWAFGGGKLGVFGRKTIQGNLKEIIEEHVSTEGIISSPVGLKTLHMRIKKGVLMEATETLPKPYKETVWFIQNLVKYAFGKITGEYGVHEVFDSTRVVSESQKNRVKELISGSFQYVPENSSIDGEMNTDGEMGSWHESSGTINELTQTLPTKSNLVVLTRFEKGHASHEAVEKQVAKTQVEVARVIGPCEPLKGHLVSVDEEHMKHNLEVGRKTARMYILALALQGENQLAAAA